MRIFNAPSAFSAKSAPLSQGILFSGKLTAPSDTFTSRTATPIPATTFGFLPLYDGPWKHVILFTDFNDGASNSEALNQFYNDYLYTMGLRKGLSKKLIQPKPLSKTMWQPWAKPAKKPDWQKLGYLDVRTFDDIPYGNINYAAFSLLRLMGKDRIVVAVTDPGVDNKDHHDRSIMVTQNHGVVIGPNNGVLSLVGKALAEANDPPKMIPISLAKVTAFEQARRQAAGYTNSKTYVLPQIFHGRDLFALIAGAISGGIDPETFRDDNRSQVALVPLDFAAEVSPIPTVFKQLSPMIAFRDHTFGNVKTNIYLDDQTVQQLIQQQAVFEVRSGDQRWAFPFKSAFSQVPVGENVAYVGSTYVDTHGQKQRNYRFLELAINLGDASALLAIPPQEAKRFSIERIQ